MDGDASIGDVGLSACVMYSMFYTCDCHLVLCAGAGRRNLPTRGDEAIYQALRDCQSGSNSNNKWFEQ